MDRVQYRLRFCAQPHSIIFPRYLKHKGDWESVARRRGYGKYIPRRVIYCCVPLCHSYSGKVVNGKTVKLHRLPKDSKARRIWIANLLGSEMCVKIFLQSLEQECAACILKAKKAQSRAVSFQLCSPRSQPQNLHFDGINPCLTDIGDQ